METLEDKRTMLEHFGRPLVFPSFTIQGINGEDYSIVNFEVDTLAHRPIVYYFQITQEDMESFGISKDDTFTTTVIGKVFHWKLSKRPFIDVYGWVKLTANLVKVV